MATAPALSCQVDRAAGRPGRVNERRSLDYLHGGMSERSAGWAYYLTARTKWYWGAVTRYDIHSPFLVDFIGEVYRDRRYYHGFAELSRKHKLLDDAARLSDKDGRLLFRLSLWLRPTLLYVEGRTDNPISSYLLAADSRTHIVDTLPTTDSAPETEPTQKLLIVIDLRSATAGPALQRILDRPPKETTVVVLGNHGNPRAEDTWKRALRSPAVCASIDLFSLGILVVRDGLSERHVSLVGSRYKPWRLGFF